MNAVVNITIYVVAIIDWLTIALVDLHVAVTVIVNVLIKHGVSRPPKHRHFEVVRSRHHNLNWHVGIQREQLEAELSCTIHTQRTKTRLNIVNMSHIAVVIIRNEVRRVVNSSHTITAGFEGFHQLKPWVNIDPLATVFQIATVEIQFLLAIVCDPFVYNFLAEMPHCTTTPRFPLIQDRQ